jgi:hypothetical protein
LKDLTEGAGLELAKLQQVQRGRDERQRHQRESQRAQGHMQNEPHVPACGQLGLGCQAAQDRETEQAGRERRGKERDRGPAQQALAGELEQHEAEGEDRQGGSEADEREPRDTDDVRGRARAGHGDREASGRRAKADERSERERRRQRVQRECNQVERDDHREYRPDARKGAHPAAFFRKASF